MMVSKLAIMLSTKYILVIHLFLFVMALAGQEAESYYLPNSDSNYSKINENALKCDTFGQKMFLAMVTRKAKKYRLRHFFYRLKYKQVKLAPIDQRFYIYLVPYHHRDSLDKILLPGGGRKFMDSTLYLPCKIYINDSLFFKYRTNYCNLPFCFYEGSISDRSIREHYFVGIFDNIELDYYKTRLNRKYFYSIILIDGLWIEHYIDTLTSISYNGPMISGVRLQVLLKHDVIEFDISEHSKYFKRIK